MSSEIQNNTTVINKNNQTGNLKLAKIFGDTIASPYNQHIICMIVGKTGTGKSYAALDLAYKTAEYIAENKLGGNPEDYFDVDRNMALITMDSIINVLQNMKQYNVYVMDDIGTGWNARDFAKQKNKIMNNIVQTFRNWNSLLILTLPDNFLIDTVPRNLLHYQIEMTNKQFQQGLTMGKVTKIIKNHRLNKTYYKFVETGKEKYVLWTFEKPPEDVLQKYDRLRDRIQKEEQEKYIQQLNDLKEEQEKPKEEGRPKVKVRKYENEILVIHRNNPEYSAYKIAEQLGCSQPHVRKILLENENK